MDFSPKFNLKLQKGGGFGDYSKNSDQSKLQLFPSLE
jgi:hypothetical protein